MKGPFLEGTDVARRFGGRSADPGAAQGSEQPFRGFMCRRGVWRRVMSIRATKFIGVLIVLLAVAFLVLPPPGETQQAASLPRIGFLAPASLSDPRVPPYMRAFQEGLRELGYVEGRNIALEFRWAEGQYERLPGLAAELVRLNVNIIVAAGPNAIQAAKEATATIPIVMAAVGDPVAAGFVASLARPGGNVTGISNMLPDLVGKQLELLKEVVPTVSRVALLGNPANPANASLVRPAEDAARTLGIRLQPLWARDLSEIDSAFTATKTADSLIVLTDTMLLNHRTRITDHAGRRRLPTVFGVSQFVEAGGLLAYGPSFADGYRRAAPYVDKILKGAKPADLPIAQPATFELVINLKAAKALGLTIHPAVLLRADRVIQ
jgi:putative ABC transport system substrate-binding protein